VTGIKVKVSRQSYRQNRQRSAPWDHKEIVYSTLLAKLDALHEASSSCKTRITYVALMALPYPHSLSLSRTPSHYRFHIRCARARSLYLAVQNVDLIVAEMQLSH
jgi:hypothetical protein